MNFILILFFSFLISKVGLICLKFIFKKPLSITSYYRCDVNFHDIKVISNSKISSALKKSGFKKVSNNGDFFTAKTNFSLYSFSEDIEINRIQKNNKEVLLTFSSTCFSPLQVIDWGKNKRNAKLFFKNLGLNITCEAL